MVEQSGGRLVPLRLGIANSVYTRMHRWVSNVSCELYREKPNEISRTPNIPFHQNNVVATRVEPSSKDIPTWNSFLQQATASQVCIYVYFTKVKL